MMYEGAKQLRRLLAEKETIYSAGIGNAYMARIANQADGIDAVLTSGFQISAYLFGLPDAEMYTRTDNVLITRAICDVSTKPVIADCDSGYGNAVTVIRTVNEFERAGVAAVTIEDQLSPKHCNLCVSGAVPLLPVKEAAGKIRAAAENRLNKDTVIVARCDSEDYDDLMERVYAYIDAGADVIQTMARAFGGYNDKFAKFIQDLPVPYSTVIASVIEDFTAEQIAAFKPKIAHWALAAINADTYALKETFRHLGENHSCKGLSVGRATHEEITDLLGWEKIRAAEQAYLPNEDDL